MKDLGVLHISEIFVLSVFQQTYSLTAYLIDLLPFNLISVSHSVSITVLFKSCISCNLSNVERKFCLCCSLICEVTFGSWSNPNFKRISCWISFSRSCLFLSLYRRNSWCVSLSLIKSSKLVFETYILFASCIKISAADWFKCIISGIGWACSLELLAEKVVLSV